MKRVKDGCHERFIESCADDCSHLGDVFSRLLIRNIFQKVIAHVKRGLTGNEGNQQCFER